MSTNNICFCWEIRKILCGYPLLSVAMFASLLKKGLLQKERILSFQNWPIFRRNLLCKKKKKKEVTNVASLGKNGWKSTHCIQSPLANFYHTLWFSFFLKTIPIATSTFIILCHALFGNYQLEMVYNKSWNLITDCVRGTMHCMVFVRQCHIEDSR